MWASEGKIFSTSSHPTCFDLTDGSWNPWPNGKAKKITYGAKCEESCAPERTEPALCVAAHRGLEQ